jgi:HD-GYP domain-containing protein (c-di-GMP phosphodiesterase class II)/DNA-binding CsgD family transcriptional regulator
MALPAADRLAVYYASLLKDAGCTSWTSALAAFWETDEIVARRELVLFGGMESTSSFLRWIARHVGRERAPAARARAMLRVLREQPAIVYEALVTTSDVAMRIATRLGMPQVVSEGVASLYERWDGKGLPDGKAGAAIPLLSRVMQPTLLLAPVFRRYGRTAAIELIRKERAVAFDPDVCDAFLAVAQRQSFWDGLEDPDVWGRVLAEEPASAVAYISEQHIDDVVLAFADFADLKSPSLYAHSRRTAALAETLARELGCAEQTVSTVRRSALVHDLGMVAIPSAILNKPADRYTTDERERVRLHPYHTERLLSRVPPLAEVASIAGMHHERMDGHGYFRGVPAAQIPLGSRILAVASRFDELTHDAPVRPAFSLDGALAAVSAEAGTAFAADVVGALPAAVGYERSKPQRGEWPAGLTAREVEVLRLAGKGMTRRDIAGALRLSENTVRHHLEHIYNKTGASTRVGAVLFAMEQGLLE